MCMTMSYPTTILMVDELAKDHDKTVLQWKESLSVPSQVNTDYSICSASYNIFAQINMYIYVGACRK